MAGEIVGANVAQLRVLAMHFEDAQERIHTLAGVVTARVNQPGYWGGDDADRFRTEWNNGHRTRLLSTQTLLSTAARDLRRNADEQERTSGSDTGTTTGGPGGSSGAPGNPTEQGSSDDSSGAPLLGSLNAIWNGINLANGALGLAALPVAIARLQTMGQLAGSFDTLQDALTVADRARNLTRLDGLLSGAGWADEVQRLSNVIPDAGLAGRVGWLTGPLGTAGKFLGPAGVVLGGITTINDFAQGNYDRGVYNAITTGLGTAALFTPPPANLVLGVAAGGMALGQLVYDNWDSIESGISTAWEWTGDRVEDVGEAVSDGVEAIGDGLEAAGEALWPF
ncbi:hypothetical protein GCM10027403_10100 [Arthrobacter tecti]